jgi:hypothetical protein
MLLWLLMIQSALHAELPGLNTAKDVPEAPNFELCGLNLGASAAHKFI